MSFGSVGVFTSIVLVAFAGSVFSSNIVLLCIYHSLIIMITFALLQKTSKIKDPREPATMECSPCWKENESKKKPDTSEESFQNFLNGKRPGNGRVWERYRWEEGKQQQKSASIL